MPSIQATQVPRLLPTEYLIPVVDPQQRPEDQLLVERHFHDKLESISLQAVQEGREFCFWTKV